MVDIKGKKKKSIVGAGRDKRGLKKSTKTVA